MNLTDLRATRSDQLSTAAQRFGRCADLLERAGERLLAEVRGPLEASWRGPAATAALDHIAKLAKRLDRAQQQMETSGRAVSRFADAVEDARQLVRRAEQLASEWQLEIGADGSVALPRQSGFDIPPTVLSAMSEVQNLLEQAVGTATEADAACARVLAPRDRSDEGQGDGGGSIWSDVWKGVGTASSVASVVQAADSFLPGGTLLPEFPGMQPLGLVTSGAGAVSGIADLVQNGGRASDYAGTALNVSATAFAVAPSPVTAAAVLGSGAAWVGAEAWDHREQIGDAAGAVWDAGGEAVGWGADRAGDAAGAVWDAGGDAVESAGDALDAAGDFVSDINPLPWP